MDRGIEIPILSPRIIIREFYLDEVEIDNLPSLNIHLENKFFIIETKGRVDIDVEAKDNRAKVWCEDAARLTGNEWIFARIDQEEFERHRFRSVKELISTLAG